MTTDRGSGSSAATGALRVLAVGVSVSAAVGLMAGMAASQEDTAPPAATVPAEPPQLAATDQPLAVPPQAPAPWVVPTTLPPVTTTSAS